MGVQWAQRMCLLLRGENEAKVDVRCIDYETSEIVPVSGVFPHVDVDTPIHVVPCSSARIKPVRYVSLRAVSGPQGHF